jgi:hypothetical protein
MIKLQIASRRGTSDAETRALLGPMIAKLPSIAAMAYKPALAQPIVDKYRQSQSLPPLSLSRCGVDATRFLIVEAFVNATVTRTRIQGVLDYASKFSINEPYTQPIVKAAPLEGEDREVLTERVSRHANVTAKPWLEEDAIGWLFPYRGRGANPRLAARFHDLGSLPSGTLGRAYWEQYQSSGYAFPGEPEGVNEVIALPHDCTHLLSGFNPTPKGEVLASAFTWAMHGSRLVEAHFLPMLLGWDLGKSIDNLAVAALPELDTRQFWHAWARGACSKDLFAPGWDFWRLASESLAELRQTFGIPSLHDVETA